MRKALMVGAGLVSAAVVAVGGIASANAVTGSSDRTPARHVTSTSATAYSQADAEQAALNAVPDGTVTETRLDTDNGRTVWNVHLITPNGAVEVKVDAQTGEVRVDDAPDAGLNSGTVDGDDAPGHDAHDDHGQNRGRDDGPGHDMTDDRGRGGDDGPGHE